MVFDVSNISVMPVKAAEDIGAVLNQYFQLGQSSYYEISYLERANGGLHDSILIRL